MTYRVARANQTMVCGHSDGWVDGWVDGMDGVEGV